MSYDFLLLYPVPPKTLADYRQAFFSSGAKSDPEDADLLLELVRCHADRLRVCQPRIGGPGKSQCWRSSVATWSTTAPR